MTGQDAGRQAKQQDAEGAGAGDASSGGTSAGRGQALRETLTLGSRPLDAPGSPVSSQQAGRIASGRATWHRRASKPVTYWIVALFVVLMTHRWIPESIWLMVHMVTLGLITNSIFIWSQHFTEALLKHRLPDSARPAQLVRIYTLNISMILLMLSIV